MCFLIDKKAKRNQRTTVWKLLFLQRATGKYAGPWYSDLTYEPGQTVTARGYAYSDLSGEVKVDDWQPRDGDSAFNGIYVHSTREGARKATAFISNRKGWAIAKCLVSPKDWMYSGDTHGTKSRNMTYKKVYVLKIEPLT